jgi:ribonuclease J
MWPKKMPDEKVLVLTTGSQGESMSAMTRIANGEHAKIKIREGDTVVFSANPIPGNTIAVVNTIDKLMMKGAKVVYGRDQGIHVSGHASQEDQKLMLSLTRPRFFLPVHGEHRMLVKHSQTAQAVGVPAENMIIIDNGDVVELGEDFLRTNGKVPAGIELVDTSRSGIVNDKVLKERRQLAGDGVMTIATAVDGAGKLMTKPEVHLRGVVTTIDRGQLQAKVRDTIEGLLRDRWTDFARPLGDNGEIHVDWAGLQYQIERDLQRMLRKEVQSNPLLVFLMQTPEQEAPVISSGNSAAAKAPVTKAAPPKPTPEPSPEEPSTTGRRKRRVGAMAS